MRTKDKDRIISDESFIARFIREIDYKSVTARVLQNLLNEFPRSSPCYRGRSPRRNPDELEDPQAYKNLRGELALRHMRLVAYIAKKFYGRYHNFDDADLIQEGFIGMCKAIDRYDSSLSSIATYATPWIKVTLQRAVISTGHFIRAPAYLMGSKKDRMKTLSAMPKIIRISRYSMSIQDEIIGPDDKSGEAADTAERHELVEHMMKGLKDRDRHIINLRFGLVDDQPRTLEEVGQIIGVSRERIRQIETRAMAIMKQRGGWYAKGDSAGGKAPPSLEEEMWALEEERRKRMAALPYKLPDPSKKNQKLISKLLRRVRMRKAGIDPGPIRPPDPPKKMVHPSKSAKNKGPVPQKKRDKLFLKCLGYRLWETRVQSFLTIHELSHRSMVSGPTIKRFEKGIGPIRIETLSKLAVAMKTTASAIMYLAERDLEQSLNLGG